ncbi:MAG: NTP transferase domain-containing protein [Nitrospina sp.]|nr:NTP transferase domain-containing protein [Nitrospina sp.]
MNKIKIAIAGVGNCASALVQGLHYYRGRQLEEAIGLMHGRIGGYRPEDIEVVAALDVDRRKVGRGLHEAIFAKPNCAAVFFDRFPGPGVTVRMGKVFDGISPHMADYAEERTFLVADAPEPAERDVIRLLRQSGAEILLNYLPVGSEEATRFYAECALAAGVGFINCIPVFIASDPVWARRFEENNLPLVGDDIKSQLGATITHRLLTDLFRRRGVKLDRTYQLNTGGNTDFLNMKNPDRLASKKQSKTESVQSMTPGRLDADSIHIGPSDYVPWQGDNKVAFIRMEGRIFGNVPVHMELRLSVEDSPNSAGVAIDMIRCVKLALERKVGGVLGGPSAFFCKHPPRQFTDNEAFNMTESFIRNSGQGRKPCLIIAAGRGERLRAAGDCKPLTPLYGVPLIERVIGLAMEAGAEEFFVVTGYQAEKLNAFLNGLAGRFGVPLTTLHNREWEKGNGVSVLKARESIQKPFLLLMADHLFDPGIARELMARPPAGDEVVLATDSDLNNAQVNMDDVTRVLVREGRIAEIGKQIAGFNAFDTGIFHCGTGLFETLDRLYRESGDVTLSQAVQVLARQGRARSWDAAGRFWIDIDDPGSFRKAENLLLDPLESPPLPRPDQQL